MERGKTKLRCVIIRVVASGGLDATFLVGSLKSILDMFMRS